MLETIPPPPPSFHNLHVDNSNPLRSNRFVFASYKDGGIIEWPDIFFIRDRRNVIFQSSRVRFFKKLQR